MNAIKSFVKQLSFYNVLNITKPAGIPDVEHKANAVAIQAKAQKTEPIVVLDVVKGHYCICTVKAHMCTPVPGYLHMSYDDAHRLAPEVAKQLKAFIKIVHENA